MRRAVATFVVLVAVGAGIGAAWASVSSTGAGSGAATVNSAQTVTIDATAQDPSASLLPGGTADATFAVDNLNPVTMTLISVVQSGAITVAGAGCTLANSGVTFTNQTGLTIVVPANASVYNVDLPTALTMATSSANACQNATFQIPITITVQQG
jgi:hypothetical protein